MDKAEIVKKWKPDLKARGFVYRDNMFQLQETTNQPLHFTISLQRNLHSETSFSLNAMLLQGYPGTSTPLPPCAIDGGSSMK